MASVNQICEDLIRNVTNCDLDYKMHQTPFSLFFSIRKKFTKNSNYGASFQNPVPSEELLHIRQEYRNLFNFFQAEVEAKQQIESQLISVKEEIVAKGDLISNFETEMKRLKIENRDLGGKFEEKCKEIKQLKTEVNSLNKDKNILGVANKSVKQELKEQNKTFEKRAVAYEKKISELNEFRSRKLNEEREERIKIKKELKKEAKKLKHDTEKAEVKIEDPQPDAKPELEKDFEEANIEEGSVNESSCEFSKPGKGYEENGNQTVKIEGLDDNANETDENLSHIPSVPTHNQFHVLNQSCVEENPRSLVTTSHDTTCSLKTTARQHPTNSSMDTSTTSLVASSSLDNLVTRALANNDEEREMLRTLMKKFDDMIGKCES